MESKSGISHKCITVTRAICNKTFKEIMPFKKNGRLTNFHYILFFPSHVTPLTVQIVLIIFLCFKSPGASFGQTPLVKHVIHDEREKIWQSFMRNFNALIGTCQKLTEILTRIPKRHDGKPKMAIFRSVSIYGSKATPATPKSDSASLNL